MPVIPSQYYYVTLVLLSICSLAGLFIAYRLQRDVAESSPTTEKDIAKPLEKAFASGLMDEAEFRRIQESIRKQKEGAGPIIPPRPLRAKPGPAVPGPIEDESADEGEGEPPGEG